MKTTIHIISMFVLLVLAQVVIFNNLIICNVAMPFVFIYLIMRFPVTFNPNLSLTVAFLLGLCVDIFSDTLGVNTISCTLLAALQRPVFYLYQQRDEDLSGQSPSMRTMGSPAFLKYMLTLALLYCVFVFTIEAFSFFNIKRLLLRIVCSTIFTSLIIGVLDGFTLRQRHEKGL